MSYAESAGGDILTTEEAAVLLRIDARTIIASVHAGTVPVLRLGVSGHIWRFSRTALMQAFGVSPKRASLRSKRSTSAEKGVS